MAGGLAVFVVGLALYLTKWNWSVGDLGAQTISYLVMGLGIAVFIIDLLRVISRNRSRRSRSNARASAAEQQNTARRSEV